jgi:glycosyltransferase involved in cell wall biosynthesis
MKSKTLTFAIPNFGIGGVEINFQKLANCFIDRGYSVRILFHDEHDDGSFKSKFNTRIKLDKLSKNNFLVSFRDYVKYFNKEKPSIVIVAMYMTAIQLIIARFFSHQKPRIIVNGSTHFSSLIKYEKNIKISYLLKPLSKLFLAKADMLVCQSSGIEEDLRKILNVAPEKLITIYNGVLDDNFEITGENKPSHPWLMDKLKDFSVITMVGRLDPAKSILEFIDIFFKIQERINIKMIIIGEGMLKKMIEDKINSMHLENQIDVIPFQENFHSYIKASDALVVNSIYEGFNNIIVHALACGTPVISRDCLSGPSEILSEGEYGYLVQPNDDEKMIDTIIEAINQPKFKSDDLIERSKLFTVKNCADRFEQLFDRILP